MQTMTASQMVREILEKDKLTKTVEIIDAIGHHWPMRTKDAWVCLIGEVRRRYNLQLSRAEKSEQRKRKAKPVEELGVQSLAGTIDRLPEVRPHDDVDPVVANLRGAQRLAADVVREAWETASRGGLMGRHFDVRYARAWLQTPSATAMWCDLAGVDPDEIARLSRYNHGRPTFTEAEIHTHEAKLEARRRWRLGYDGSPSCLIADLMDDFPKMKTELVLRAIISEIQGEKV